MAEIIDNIETNLELQKTLKIGDTYYNINAVYSDEAGRVTTPLVIKESLATGEQEYNFNGDSEESTKSEINYVPATGGKFVGTVYIADPEIKEISEDDKVITSGQINNRIEKLQGAPLYSWNEEDDALLYALSNSSGQFHKLNTLFGTTASFETLKKLLSNGRPGTTPGINFNITRDSDGIIPIYCRVLASNGLGTTDLTTTNLVVPYYYIFEDTAAGKTGETYRLPITGLYTGAFKNKTTIKSIVLPDSITAISQEAFLGCSSLERVVLPVKLKSINKSAFSNCRALKTINIRGTELAEIGETAFSNCTSLETLIIPKSVTSIAAKVLDGCNNPTVYYAGSEADWAAINIAEDNAKLKSVTIHYNYSVADTSSAISASQIINESFIYVCKDEETPSEPASNKMFLKLPEVEEFVEISKGASRLESPIGATAQGHYTYETLAAIIAGINARLDGLGGTQLTLPTTLPTGDTIIPEDLHLDVLGDTFDSKAAEAIPTVQSLQQQIDDIKGGEGDSIAKLRGDLNDIAKEVAYDINGKDDWISAAIEVGNSRIDKLEDDLAKFKTTTSTNINNLSNTLTTTIATEINSLKNTLDNDHGKRIEALEDKVDFDVIKGKYTTNSVGGLSAGMLDSDETIESLLKKILGIKTNAAPYGLTVNLYQGNTNTKVPAQITAGLDDDPMDITVKWSFNPGTYEGSYTKNVSIANITDVIPGNFLDCTDTSADDVNAKITLAGTHTYASIKYRFSYSAFGDGEFENGYIEQIASVTINRNCYYGIQGQTLTSAPRTTANGLSFTVTLDNKKAVFMYPKAWRACDSTNNKIKITDANGFDVTEQFTKNTEIYNGGEYLKFTLNNNNTGTFTYTISYI